MRTPGDLEAFYWGLRQFLAKAQTLARLSHVNLVPVHRFFEANQTAHIVMGYAEGETMGGVLKREQGLSEERLRRVLIDFGAARFNLGAATSSAAMLAQKRHGRPGRVPEVALKSCLVNRP